MNQRAEVFAYLLEHGSISDLEALRDLGIRRLAARIYDLRAVGHVIESTPERHEGGTHSRYRIVKELPVVQAVMGEPYVAYVAAGQIELPLSDEGVGADKRPPHRRAGMVLPTGCRPR